MEEYFQKRLKIGKEQLKEKNDMIDSLKLKIEDLILKNTEYLKNAEESAASIDDTAITSRTDFEHSILDKNVPTNAKSLSILALDSISNFSNLLLSIILILSSQVHLH